jgi:hypothetical protein
MGENFCQPPPLLLPLSRVGAELVLPGLGADPPFELRCGSGAVERDCAMLFGLEFCPD